MSRSISINGRPIGADHPVYIIAELSANHNQNFDEALRLVRAAKEAGADAVKLQTYTADTLTIDSDQPWFRIGKGTIWEGKTLHGLYHEAYTPWEWQPKIKALCTELGMDCFSTPFDRSAVEFLERMDVPAHKVASFEIVDIPLLREIGRTGKPVIMSTGMASLAEIDEAVGTLRAAGTRDLALLKCTSAYPAPPETMNLRTIPHLSDMFGVPAGLSDHTLGTCVPVAAVVLGACVIEKHFTLDRSVDGPDSKFSLEPREFRELVDSVRTTERALGRVHYGVSPEEEASQRFRRSLFVVKDVRRGETLTHEHVRSIRPGNGLAPRHFDSIIGRIARVDVERGTPLEWKHVE